MTARVSQPDAVVPLTNGQGPVDRSELDALTQEVRGLRAELGGILHPLRKLPGGEGRSRGGLRLIGKDLPDRLLHPTAPAPHLQTTLLEFCLPLMPYTHRHR